MRPDDFFRHEDDDVFGVPVSRPRFDRELIADIRRAPLDDKSDAEVAVALARLVHDELEVYGTSGNQALKDPEMREALVALGAITKRLGVSLDLPFRDFSTFRSYWLRNDGYGSWQARRDLLSNLFDEAHDELIELESRSLTSSLARPVSPHSRTGWARIDEELSELRRHFQSARTPQDYRNVGNDCVTLIEALSAQVYDPATHLRQGETEPPVAKTKQRLERFVEHAIPGADNAALRKLAKASIELAQEVKHSETPSRRDAGIASDTVILLANLLRRLADDE